MKRNNTVYLERPGHANGWHDNVDRATHSEQLWGWDGLGPTSQPAVRWAAWEGAVGLFSGWTVVRYT